VGFVSVSLCHFHFVDLVRLAMALSGVTKYGKSEGDFCRLSRWEEGLRASLVRILGTCNNHSNIMTIISSMNIPLYVNDANHVP
jgi:hypothetical protein